MPGENDEENRDLAKILPQPLFYEIRLEGRLDPAWSDWFDGFTITQTESGEIILYGPFVDQSALFGLIAYLRDRDLLLISVKRIITGKNNS